MTFFLFILVNATLFLRPAEIFPALLGLPIYEVLMVSCLIGSFNSIRQQLQPQALMKAPITLCVLGILAGVVFSHASHAYLYGIKTFGELFLKTVLYFLMLTSQVNTPARLRTFLFWVNVFACVMVTMCVIDFLGIVDFEFITHYTDRDGVSDEGTANFILRMRGSGIFEDPNDISLVIVTAGVLCFYFLNDERAGVFRAAWLLPMAVLGLALLLTRSRGGLMSAGMAAVVWTYLQHGRTTAIAVCVAGLLALPLVGGRQGDLSLDEGTGNERIHLWKEGLVAMRSSDFVFGTGAGTYADIAQLVAHNSYIHSFVELGIFGGTFFLGCYYFSAVILCRIGREPPLPGQESDRRLSELARFHPYMAAIIANWGLGMLSLSRCYVAPPYLVFGLVAVFAAIWSRYRENPEPLVRFDRTQFMRLAGASVTTLVGFNIFVRIFAG